MDNLLHMVDLSEQLAEKNGVLLYAGALLCEIDQHLLWLVLNADRANLHAHLSKVLASLSPRLKLVIEAIREQIPAQMDAVCPVEDETEAEGGGK